MVGEVRPTRSRLGPAIDYGLTDVCLVLLLGHGQDVRCVDWHPTKGLIVSGSTDDKVSFWDPRSGQALAS